VITLGIETSCDETAVAVVEDGFSIRSNLIATQVDLHARYGGIVPEVAARAHVEVLNPLMDQALQEAGVFALVLEAIPAELAGRATEALSGLPEVLHVTLGQPR